MISRMSALMKTVLKPVLSGKMAKKDKSSPTIAPKPVTSESEVEALGAPNAENPVKEEIPLEDTQVKRAELPKEEPAQSGSDDSGDDEGEEPDDDGDDEGAVEDQKVEEVEGPGDGDETTMNPIVEEVEAPGDADDDGDDGDDADDESDDEEEIQVLLFRDLGKMVKEVGESAILAFLSEEAPELEGKETITFAARPICDGSNEFIVHIRCKYITEILCDDSPQNIKEGKISPLQLISMLNYHGFSVLEHERNQNNDTLYCISMEILPRNSILAFPTQLPREIFMYARDHFASNSGSMDRNQFAIWLNEAQEVLMQRDWYRMKYNELALLKDKVLDVGGDESVVVDPSQSQDLPAMKEELLRTKRMLAASVDEGDAFRREIENYQKTFNYQKNEVQTRDAHIQALQDQETQLTNDLLEFRDKFDKINKDLQQTIDELERSKKETRDANEEVQKLAQMVTDNREKFEYDLRQSQTRVAELSRDFDNEVSKVRNMQEEQTHFVTKISEQTAAAEAACRAVKEIQEMTLYLRSSLKESLSLAGVTQGVEVNTMDGIAYSMDLLRKMKVRIPTLPAPPKSESVPSTLSSIQLETPVSSMSFSSFTAPQSSFTMPGMEIEETDGHGSTTSTDNKNVADAPVCKPAGPAVTKRVLRAAHIPVPPHRHSGLGVDIGSSLVPGLMIPKDNITQIPSSKSHPNLQSLVGDEAAEAENGTPSTLLSVHEEKCEDSIEPLIGMNVDNVVHKTMSQVQLTDVPLTHPMYQIPPPIELEPHNRTRSVIPAKNRGSRRPSFRTKYNNAPSYQHHYGTHQIGMPNSGPERSSQYFYNTGQYKPHDKAFFGKIKGGAFIPNMFTK